MVEHVLVGVNSTEDRPLIDANLDRGLRNVLGNEEDEGYFVDASLANKYGSRVIFMLRKL